MPTSSLKVPTSVPLRRRFLEWITWRVEELTSCNKCTLHTYFSSQLAFCAIVGATTYRQFQDFVEHNIWRDVEVEDKILESQKVTHHILKKYACYIEDVIMTNLIVVWAVGRFFHWGVLLIFSNLHTDYWIHVLPHQLPGFNYCHIDLKFNDK